MLTALGAGFLVVPFLAADVTAEQDAILQLALIHDHLRRLAPDLYINGVIDVVAVLSGVVSIAQQNLPKE